MAVLGEIPGFGRYVIFHFNAGARLARAHLALDAHDAAHEVIGRAGQSCHATRPIKARVHRSKSLGRLAPGAGEQRALIEAKTVHLGHGPGLRVLAHQLRVARQRPVGHQAQADPARVKGLQPIDRA